MSNERREQLLSAALDDDLDDEERRELDALLEESGGREDRQAYAAMHDLLKDVEAAAPPAALQAAIRRQARLPAGRAQGWQWLFPGLRYAVAASAGALATLAVLNADSVPGAGRVDQLGGSMAPADVRQAHVPVVSRRFAAEGFESLVSLRPNAAGLALSLDLESRRPLDVAVRLDGTGLLVDGLAGVDGELGNLSIRPDSLNLSVRGGRRLEVLLRRRESASQAEAAAPIRLDFSSEGELLEQGALQQPVR